MSIANKNILLGVTGGIAAYKAPDLVRKLTALGANVRVVLTDSAAEFVSSLSLQLCQEIQCIASCLILLLKPQWAY